MDNRKNYINELHEHTLVSLNPAAFLTGLIKKITILFTELDADTTADNFDLLKNEVTSAFSGWLAWLQQTDRQKIIDNFKNIKNIISEVKHIDVDQFNKYVVNQSVNDKLQNDNFFIIEKLLLLLSVLSTQRLGVIINLLHEIEQVLRIKHQDVGGYELAFCDIPANVDLNNEEEKKSLKEASEKNGSVPIVIKQNNNIYLFGNKKLDDKDALDWDITQLDEAKFNADLFPEKKLTYKLRNKDKVKEEIYKEIKNKGAHIHSELAKKIQTYILLFKDRNENIIKLTQGVEIYTQHITIIQKDYHRILNLIKKIEVNNNDLNTLIEDNRKIIHEATLSSNEIKKYFAEVSLSLQLVKKELKSTSANSVSHEESISSLEQSLKINELCFNTISSSMDNSIRLLDDFINDFNINHKKLLEVIDKFNKKSQDIIDKIYFNNLDEDIKDIQILSREIKAIKSEFANVLSPNDSLKITTHTNWLLVKQNLAAATKIKEKLLLLVKEINQLKNQPNLNKENSILTRRGPSELSRLTIEESSEDLLDSVDDENINRDQALTSFQEKRLINYLRNQIKNHQWDVRGIPKPVMLINEVVNRDARGKATLNTTQLVTPYHAVKMVNIFNAFAMQPTMSTLYCKELRKINYQANHTFSLFRTNNTALTYKRIDRDIKQVALLSQCPDADPIFAHIQVMNDNFDITDSMVNYANIYQKICNNKKLKINDRLIEIYYLTHDYLRNNRALTEGDTVHLYNVSLTLRQIDIGLSLQNIESAIIRQCVNRKWPPMLSYSSIMINEANYVVPKHIKRIWRLLLICHQASEATKEAIMLHTLSKIEIILEKTIITPSHFRHAKTQQFYMDLLNEIIKNPNEVLCQKLN